MTTTSPVAPAAERAAPAVPALQEPRAGPEARESPVVHEALAVPQARRVQAGPAVPVAGAGDRRPGRRSPRTGASPHARDALRPGPVAAPRAQPPAARAPDAGLPSSPGDRRLRGH